MTQDELNTITECLGLMNSMINSGEIHSLRSEDLYNKSSDICNKYLAESIMSEFADENGWISVEKELPKDGEVCDVWLTWRRVDGKDLHAHRRCDYLYLNKERYHHSRDVWQEEYCAKAGIFEMAFYVDENIITHWRPVPKTPVAING